MVKLFKDKWWLALIVVSIVIILSFALPTVIVEGWSGQSDSSIDLTIRLFGYAKNINNAGYDYIGSIPSVYIFGLILSAMFIPGLYFWSRYNQKIQAWLFLSLIGNGLMIYFAVSGYKKYLDDAPLLNRVVADNTAIGRYWSQIGYAVGIGVWINIIIVLLMSAFMIHIIFSEKEGT